MDQWVDGLMGGRVVVRLQHVVMWMAGWLGGRVLSKIPWLCSLMDYTKYTIRK